MLRKHLFIQIIKFFITLFIICILFIKFQVMNNKFLIQNAIFKLIIVTIY